MYNRRAFAKATATLIAIVIGVLLAPDARASFSATPINDLGTGTYLGFQGGLYPNGSNTMPAGHAAAGMQKASLIEPRNLQGNPDPNGKIVFLSIGMSNTKQEFCGPTGSGADCDAWSFVGQAINDPEVNHDTLVMVNGAQGGQTAPDWVSPTNLVYRNIKTGFLTPIGLSEAQVQAVWLKNANPGPDIGLPSPQADAYVLMDYFGDTLRALKIRYPNLQQVYISSRIYAGYTTSPLNPEPYAYESGFAVKWLIEAQINQMATGAVNPITGDLNYNSVTPWISWGPYTWADGLNPRSDGLTWTPADYDPDMTHPSQEGETQVGSMLLEFFENSPHSESWFTDDLNLGIPIAVIEAAPLEGSAPLQVLFDGSSSTDDRKIVSYFWDFGDSATSTAKAPQHTYLSTGFYTATLTVTDDDGYSDTASVEIRVSEGDDGCVDQCLRAASISFTTAPASGGFRIVGLVSVIDEDGSPLSNALVAVTWTLPGGSILTRQAYTNTSGIARLSVQGPAGTYSLVVDDITLGGYTFDPDNSILTGTVTIP